MTSFISIIIPTRNGAAYLTQAIDSVIGQTYPHWELWIIDDASTDRTEVLCQPYLRDSRIHYHRRSAEEHTTLAATRNCGLQKISGDFVLCLDGDDVLEAEALELLLNASHEQPHGVMIQGFYRSINEQGQLTRILGPQLIHQNGHYKLPAQHKYNILNLLTIQFPCQVGTTLFKKEVFSALGGFSEDLTHSEDFELYVRVYQNYPTGMLAIPAYVLKHRWHEQSMTKSEDQWQVQIQSHFRALKKLHLKNHLPSRQHAAMYTHWYQRFIRQQLNLGRPHLARQILKQALEDPQTTSPIDFFFLWALTRLPATIYQYGRTVWHSLRKH